MAYIRKKSCINTAESFNVNRWTCSTREKVLGVGGAGRRRGKDGRAPEIHQPK